MTLTKIAKSLDIDPEVLEAAVSKLFVAEQFRLLEAERLRIEKKFKITSLADFEKKLTEGKLKEENVHDDFFRFDHILARRKKRRPLSKIYKHLPSQSLVL